MFLIVIPIVLKNCFPARTLNGQTFPSLSINFHLSFLLEVGLHTTCSKLPFNCFDFLSKVFESLLNRDNHSLTTFYLIVSMASDLDALLAIFWISLLTLSHPFLDVFVKLLLLPQTHQRHLKGVWQKVLIYKFLSFGFYLSLCSLIYNFLSDRLLHLW